MHDGIAVPERSAKVNFKSTNEVKTSHVTEPCARLYLVYKIGNQHALRKTCIRRDWIAGCWLLTGERT